MTLHRPTLLALLVVAASTPVAFAAEPATLTTIDARATARLVIDCHDRQLPSLRSVAAVLDTNNAGVIYGEREKLVHIAGRECARGYRDVVFVRAAASAAPALALADTQH